MLFSGAHPLLLLSLLLIPLLVFLLLLLLLLLPCAAWVLLGASHLMLPLLAVSLLLCYVHIQQLHELLLLLLLLLPLLGMCHERLQVACQLLHHCCDMHVGLLLLLVVQQQLHARPR
jgi:hypothetical protein